MPVSRTVFVAGAGIGGLTSALALAARGFHVVLAERAEKIEEVGAGLQLSPNATRILAALGLADRIAANAVAPDAIVIKSARTGRPIVDIPLGESAALRYGAPYWVIHRGDLQAALYDAAKNHPDIDIRLNTHCEDVAAHANGATVVLRQGVTRTHEPALAVVAADGVWSQLRRLVAPQAAPVFSGRTAWRGTIDAAVLPKDYLAPRVQLWLGPNAHIVVYPVKNTKRINVVAVIADEWNRPGWSEAGDGAALMAHFAAPEWPGAVRLLLGAVEEWKRWALFSLPNPPPMAQGALALLGDAAHAMLPFIAQGAGAAIEDAAVLAHCLAEQPTQADRALQRYAKLRASRVARIQRAAAKADHIYHLSGLSAEARNLAMRLLGGSRLLARHDWIYNWQPPRSA